MGQRDIVSYETSVRRKSRIRTASTMCRLDVDCAVKGPEQHRNALPSSRYMVGRGVKRKLSDCEDQMLDLPYPQQRQLVLDLCLDKLQSCQRRAEPSLHRSVLLANTLRQIQQEMRQEGGLHLESPPPAPATPRHSPDLPPVPSDHPSTPVAALSSSLLCEDDAQSTCTELPKGPGSEDGGKSQDLLFGSFEITNSTSYLTDLQLDDIFEDIDTSMYDPSDFSVLACPPPRGSSGASLGNDYNLKAFSTSSSTLQMCLNDLDHIMEILVRS
ncbi:SERTA domain-containing protein 2 isoform X1 [Oncorhynchus nerka]|uniref:SERTA domain-containing protein 2 isoform X1 n=2 Tax=Oncorhynchus nerka TaxID=8023 RepID=UPI00113054EA|nr:SERTA domain-containing protein 2-like isoform X1 [Oncorhynchus nerka]